LWYILRIWSWYIINFPNYIAIKYIFNFFLWANINISTFFQLYILVYYWKKKYISVFVKKLFSQKRLFVDLKIPNHFIRFKLDPIKYWFWNCRQHYDIFVFFISYQEFCLFFCYWSNFFIFTRDYILIFILVINFWKICWWYFVFWNNFNHPFQKTRSIVYKVIVVLF